jgi:GTP-binding protein
LIAAAEWAGVEFDVVDTGGLSQDPASDMETHIRNQADIAIEQADVIVLVTDVKTGVVADDQALAARLRRSGKPTVLAVNKADSPERRLESPEFWALGLGTPYPVSALHGSGTGDMLDAVVGHLSASELAEEPEDDRLRIAIVGRPNVGKSSLVNRLAGSERVIVTGEAGTTRDAIDTTVTVDGEEIVLVDTAGIRRRGKVEPGIEKYSVLRAARALERADVAILVIDAPQGVTAQDAHIGGEIAAAQVGAIIAVNKWDLVEKDAHTAAELERHFREELKFLDYAPIVFLSALTGQRVPKLFEMAKAVDLERHARVSTSELNRLVADIQARHNPPSKFGKRLRIYYATQVAEAPPTFAFFVNDTRLVHFTYERFVANQLRRLHPFEGTPVRLSFRPRGDSDSGGGGSARSGQRRTTAPREGSKRRSR